MYSQFFKRVLDFFVALLLLIFFSLFFFMITVVLYISNSGSVFFTQDRPGKKGKIFKVIKFKTMNDKRDDNGVLLPDAVRLNGMGKFIRSTSLDEIPQLINVLKGDMSMVGPRPLLVNYLKLYTPEQNRRHDVRPGITGFAQVNGRNSISWERKFDYDVWYVDNISFFLDIKILWLTLKKVIKREGISGTNSQTMEAFKGDN